MGKNKTQTTLTLESEGNQRALKIATERFTVRVLVNGFLDKSEDEEGGVTTMDGKVNVRPKFQRAYVRELDKEWKVRLILSILNDRPINPIYLGKLTDEQIEYLYNVIDGQQRIITIADFVHNHYTVPVVVDGVTRDLYFKQLPEKWKEKILDYEVEVKICSGDEDDQLDWFQTINQPLSILTDQELRNAAFYSPMVEKAKKYFSTVRAKAKLKEITRKDSRYYGDNFSSGRKPERQEYLELALDWISLAECPMYDPITGKAASADARIRYWMYTNQTEDDADRLIAYYKAVCDWIWDTFLNIDAPVVGQAYGSPDWGYLYDKYHNQTFDTKHVSERVNELLGYYREVTNCKNIFEWVLRGENLDELSMITPRTFSKEDMERRYREQRGIDPIDGKRYEFNEMEGHHIVAWILGGSSRDYDNLVMLSKENHTKYAHSGALNGEQIKAMRDELIRKNKDK